MKSLRILAVHRYYWPDTPPYASMLKRIVTRWQQDGHNVEVLSSQPSYKSELDNKILPQSETVDGIRIERLKLPSEAGRPIIRVINAIKLSFAILVKAFLRRYDVIMISTSPPVVGGFAAALSALLTRSRFIYHCMDLHPEVGQLSGEFKNPYLYQLLLKIDSWTCSRANPVIVLSRDMEKTLRQRPHGAQMSITILNNFSLPHELSLPENLPVNIAYSDLTILFAGNIGRFQNLDIVIEAMKHLRENKNIRFIIMGEGTAKEALLNKAKSYKANVEFISHQTIEVAKAVISKVDAGFVSLAPNIYRYAYPSKTMTYLELGCPLIVAVESESELANDVRNGKYGFCLPVNSGLSLAQLLLKMSQDKSWKSTMKKNALLKASEEFSETVQIEKWSNLLKVPYGCNP